MYCAELIEFLCPCLLVPFQVATHHEHSLYTNRKGVIIACIYNSHNSMYDTFAVVAAYGPFNGLNMRIEL